ncbi:MAG: hypothetical protein LBC97_01855, partial [Bifidobacteriaceae bacterium]|nr:hypothetical protein [Bifidobacteriaceae bacterium]
VTISQGTLAAARAVAGPRGTSSLMERALKRELRLEAQRRFVQEYEREFGEITPEEVAVQMERLARAHAQSRAQASTETAAQA